MKVISGKGMCRILEQHGWSPMRAKSSHHAFQKARNVNTLIVPVHGNQDLKTGTQRDFMKDAELSDADL
jgi:predicted RNA binding protein YcfA (HicA-like mRNA interferase family)